MAFEALKQGQGRRGPQSVTALVTFNAAMLSDDKKSGGDKDYFEVTHVRGALGKKAGETDKVRLGKYEKKAGGKERPSLWDHAKGKNRVPESKLGSVLVLEGATRGNDGVIEARWVRNLSPVIQDDLNVVMASVLTKVVAVAANKEGVYSKNHYCYLIDSNRATRVGGKAQVEGETKLTLEDLTNPDKTDALVGKAKAADIDDAIKGALTQQFAGDPGFFIRAIDDENPKQPFAISFIRPNSKVGEEWVSETPEQALETFKSKHGDWYNEAKTATAGMIEIIPFVRTRAGKSSAERAIEDVIKMKEAGEKWPKDRASKPFYADVVNVKGKTEFRSCFIDSTTVLQTKDPASNFYYWTNAIPMDNKKFSDAEVITDNLAPALQAIYVEAATERGKFKAKDTKAEAEEAPENNFGEDPAIEGAAGPAPGR